MQNRKVSVGDIVISPLAKKYVNDVLNTNRLSYGPYSQKFESQFAQLHDCKHAVFSNSGTDSLKLSLQALKELGKWNDGDEVIVPAITFIATSNIVLMNNLKPVFVDVELDTYNIDPTKIEAAITQKTRAIIPVHLMGLPCNMEPIWKLAKKYHLKIIEDSCETMLATYKNKKVGSLSDVGCFSTYVAHLLVTGVGGLATTNNQKLATKIRSLMNHGRDEIYLNIDADDTATGKILENIVAKRFSYVSVGHSARCTEMEAALGLAQLEELETIVKKRQQNAKNLIQKLQSLNHHLQLPTIPKQMTHAFMLFPIYVKNEKKQGLINHLEKHGIETRDLMPLLNQPIYKKIFGSIENKFPNAKKIREHGFYLGCHQNLNSDDLEYIVATIKNYFYSKPTILTLLDTPAFGGAEQYVLDSSYILNKNGHKIIIFTNNTHVTTRYLEFIQKNKLKNFEIRTLPYLLDAIGNWKGLLKFFYHAPKACVWFYKTLQKINHDEPHVVCWFAGFSDRLLFSPIVKALKGKLIWIEIGPLLPVFNRNWGFPKLLYMLTKRFADHHTTTSKYTLQTMIKNGGINKKNITLVYPGVATFSEQEIKTYKKLGKIWRKKKLQEGNNSKRILVGFVGRLATENEVDVLINAIAKIKQSTTYPIHLVIIGDGPEKNNYQQLVKELGIWENVIFTGFVSSKEKFSILASCELFVFSRAWSWDGFGITTIEALTLGIPVISSNFGPQKEIVTHKKNGLLFKPKNSDDLAKKILFLAKSKKLRNYYGKIGQKTAQTQFSYAIMEKALLDALRKIDTISET